jgi:hypothetical protein
MCRTLATCMVHEVMPTRSRHSVTCGKDRAIPAIHSRPMDINVRRLPFRREDDRRSADVDTTRYVTCVGEMRTHPRGPLRWHRHFRSVCVRMPIMRAASAAEILCSMTDLPGQTERAPVLSAQVGDDRTRPRRDAGRQIDATIDTSHLDVVCGVRKLLICLDSRRGVKLATPRAWEAPTLPTELRPHAEGKSRIPC